MRRSPSRGWAAGRALLTIGVLGGLGALSACSEEPVMTVSSEVAVQIATDAAKASGASFAGAAGGDGQGSGSVTLGSLAQGVSFTAYAACTGGGSVGLDVAGSAHEVPCDSSAHGVGEVVAERGEVTVQVTEPNEGTSSAWGVALAQG